MMSENDFQYSQTGDIMVSACPVLVDSEKAQNSHVWGYYLCIENNSDEKIHLIGKNWNITDDKGNSFSDDSVGFKGEIPELEPGEYFEYTSMAPINAGNAVFYGSCKIKTEGREDTRDVKIPTFCLNAENSARGLSIH